MAIGKIKVDFDEDAITEPAGVGQVWKTPSKSRPGMFNVTILFDHGDVFCTCEGFKFRGACKHTERILGG